MLLHLHKNLYVIRSIVMWWDFSLSFSLLRTNQQGNWLIPTSYKPEAALWVADTKRIQWPENVFVTAVVFAIKSVKLTETFSLCSQIKGEKREPEVRSQEEEDEDR